MPVAKKPRPVDKLVQALGKCTLESTTYAKCVVADFNNVYKDKCMTEFKALQDCMTRNWGKH